MTDTTQDRAVQAWHKRGFSDRDCEELLEELHAAGLYIVSRERETALQLAIRFHETYERLAPSFGYETRTDTRQFDPESKNGKLMVAVCAEIQRGITGDTFER